MNNEINGLRAIVASEGTLHSIKEPPAREGFATDEQYEAAHHQWWLATNTWRVTRS